MKKDQKLPNSQWIAHDSNTTDVLPLTLRGSLIKCKVAYINNYYLSSVERSDLKSEYEQSDCKMSPDEFVLYNYEYLIPKRIEFVIVTLVPKYETTVKNGE